MKIVAVICLGFVSPFVALAQQPSPSTSPLPAPLAPRFAPTMGPAVSKLRAATTPPVDATPDLVTVSGRRYKHARVGSVDPDGINYFFEGGVAKIPFTDLPEAMRKQYGYDPKAAAAYAAQDAAVQQSLADTAASQELAVQYEHKAELDAADREHQAEVDAAEREKKRADAKAHATKLRIEVMQSVSGGVLAHQLVEQYIMSVASGLASVGGGGGVSGGGTIMAPSDKVIFVQGVPPTADGDRLDILAHQDGLFSYEDTNGANRTVVKWVIDN